MGGTIHVLTRTFLASEPQCQSSQQYLEGSLISLSVAAWGTVDEPGSGRGGGHSQMQRSAGTLSSIEDGTLTIFSTHGRPGRVLIRFMHKEEALGLGEGLESISFNLPKS